MKNEGKIRRLFTLDGSSYIGVLAYCTEEFLLLPAHIPYKFEEELKMALEVEVIRTFVAESSLIGSLLAGNSNGFVLSAYALDEEIKRIEESAKEQGKRIKVKRLPDKMSAVGNIILANDVAAIVHPELSEKAMRVVKEVLKVDIYKGTIGGLKTVGKAAVATNKGILAHRDATEEELEFLEEIFGVPASVGSVNFGVPMIGAALLANTKGYAAGAETTGPELGRIEDALGFV
ncbi:MAG: translation initiation factor IF-6 [Candidatus Methanospirareceae archaeon]